MRGMMRRDDGVVETCYPIRAGVAMAIGMSQLEGWWWHLKLAGLFRKSLRNVARRPVLRSEKGFVSSGPGGKSRRSARRTLARSPGDAYSVRMG